MSHFKQCESICKKMNIPPVNMPFVLGKIYKNLAIQFSQERPSVPDAVLRLSNPWTTSSTIFDSIPQEIRDYIRASKTSKSIQYTFVLPSGRIIHLKLWSPTSKKDIRSRIADIQSWFHFLDPIVSSECSQELTIFLYWTTHTKKFPQRSSKTTQILLDVIHVNSAFTYHCRKQNEIFIFREEEWFRALIHESMHAFGMDFSDMNTMNLTKKLKKEAFPGIQCTDLGIYEAYTETWAEILVILIQVFRTTHEIHPISSVKTTIQNCIYNEKCWGMSQATKVLRFYNLTYQDILDGTLYQEDRVKVFSYYIIKAILMSHVEAFISWCCHTNPHHGCFIFDPLPSTRKESMNSFCSLIIQFAKDPAFLDKMDIITSSNVSGDSLRMSLFG